MTTIVTLEDPPPPTNVPTLHSSLAQSLESVHRLRQSLLKAGGSRHLLRELDSLELRLNWAALHCCPSTWSTQEFSLFLERGRILARVLGRPPGPEV